MCLGNTLAANTYAHLPSVDVVPIRNAVYPIASTDLATKDYDAGRDNFLFFSGRGNVHKGLDRVLEAFTDTDAHLHVCQHLEPEFVRAYQRELTDLPNIHVYNFVEMRSRTFRRLANICNWVISATCAEGQPGAMLECMAHGLIPILPETANIDMGSWAIRLEDCEPETIRETMMAARRMSTEECRARSCAVAKEIREGYTVDIFRESIKSHVARAVEQ
jgi:glycosyltransferase involved in cell wall biosynthesis